MAKAYKCDLCGKYIEYAYNVDGIEFKIGEIKDELGGTYAKMNKVNEICPNCYREIIDVAKKIYWGSKVVTEI